MKKLVLMASLVLLASVSQARDKMDGCGLGWEVTDKATFLGTTTRATTNAFVPPTFGMTTGTLGCEQLSFAKLDTEAASYVATNFQSLRGELAQGHGEYVNAMVEVFGCGSDRANAIGTKIQKNYNTVVAPAKDATELFYNLKGAIGTCG